MEEGFFDSISKHGVAKRVLLYRYLQGEFAKALSTPLQSNGYNITYFDPFAGCGRYKDNLDGLESPYGNATYGSPLVALEAMLKHCREKPIQTGKTALFIFGEGKQKNFANLKYNMQKYIENIQEIDIIEVNEDNESSLQLSFTVEHRLEVTVISYMGKFQEHDLSEFQDNYPMISFLDPFGFSQIPMEKIQHLVGVRKNVLLNFMVEPINRFASTERNAENFRKLYGDPDWKSRLPDDMESLSVPEKMKEYLSAYIDSFSDACGEFNLKALAMSMRRGSERGTTKGFIYYMVFLSTNLNSMATAKYAMSVAAKKWDKDDDLYFSNFHFDPETLWKAENDHIKEQEYVMRHRKGSRCTWGEVKEWILLKTPFQIHSKTFRELEKSGKLEVISEKYESCTVKKPRTRKEFPTKVGVNSDDPDRSERLRYCNAWILQFHDQLKRKFGEDENEICRKRGRVWQK